MFVESDCFRQGEQAPIGVVTADSKGKSETDLVRFSLLTLTILFPIIKNSQGNYSCISCHHDRQQLIQSKREPPVTGVTDGPHTKNMNTKTVTNIR